ncbi:CDP-glucose 4,6-dehydratase [Herbaspirillum sp. meg3]|nr:CDP-glucose 4,6-dehydratase [Herbaspirillum sp. meg3]
MENLEMTLFADIYRGKRVLITGHTGFKGSWLTLWLSELGAQVTGIALAPATTPSHWQLLELPVDDAPLDITDAASLAAELQKTQPEVVFHLAAQPLVRRSYRDPLETWSTNVIGTANLLEACRHCTSVKAIVVITTDKCYENREWEWGYRETDRLGGHDPYSASKAAAELVVGSYRQAFFAKAGAPLLASARAGNVIGGGDWSEDRLIPDIVRAVSEKTVLKIRSPGATRPWQHVLESLSGYLLLGQKLLEEQQEFAQAWNFGPEADGNRTVEDVLIRLQKAWPAISWSVAGGELPHEANLLHLDSAKAKSRLGWCPVWPLEQTLTATAQWYRSYVENSAVISAAQLRAYIDAANAAGLAWTR